MRLVALVGIIITMALLAGCVVTPCPIAMKDAGVGRYQLVYDGRGTMVKIDTKTGETWAHGGTWKKLE